MADCPTCGDEFGSEQGMKVHHKRIHGESIAGVESTCEVCGDEFRHDPSDPGRFCTRDCQMEWQSEAYVGRGRNRVEITCAVCGDEFEVVKAREDSAKFCSTSCMGEWQSENRVGSDHPNYKGKEKLECVECGGSFEVTPARADKAKYCSHNCRRERVNVECANCGSKVERYPYNVNRSENLFCGMDCLSEFREENYAGEENPNWNGGTAFYGPSWEYYRKKAIKRDFEKCFLCGLSREAHPMIYKQGINVHHVKPRGEGGSNKCKNTITVCKVCHNGIE